MDKSHQHCVYPLEPYKRYNMTVATVTEFSHCSVHIAL